MFYLILGVITIVGGAVILTAWLAFVVLAVIAGALYGLIGGPRDWLSRLSDRIHPR